MSILVLYDKNSTGFQGTNLPEQVEDLAKSLGFQTKARSINGNALKPCTGCFGCWTKTPGLCVFTNDEVNK